MDERKDPLALWVGTWTPEDAIDVEARQLRRSRTEEADERDPSDSETDVEGGRR